MMLVSGLFPCYWIKYKASISDKEKNKKKKKKKGKADCEQDI